MQMEEKTIQLNRQLNILFWSVFLSSVLLGILQLSVIPHDYIDAQTGINLQSTAILVLLCSIPLALKMYHKKLVSVTLPGETEQRVALIHKWFVIRLVVIDIAFLLNIAVYSFTRNTSSLFCCGIIFMILLFFCRPNKTEIFNILSKE